MNALRIISLFVFLPLSWLSLQAANLSAIDRSVHKEPSYRTPQPKYCLLVFGPKALTRVWLVLDGNRLFVDRNGNLDLTDDGESIKGKPHAERLSELQFDAGTLSTHVGVLPKSRLEVWILPDMAFVYCYTEGRPWQRAVVDPAGYLRFAHSPQDAPVLHFNGPLTVGLRFNHKFKRHGPQEDLDIMVGTPGVGPGSFVRFCHDGVGKSLRPTVEIEFPGANRQAIQIKTTLDQRC